MNLDNSRLVYSRLCTLKFQIKQMKIFYLFKVNPSQHFHLILINKNPSYISFFSHNFPLTLLFETVLVFRTLDFLFSFECNAVFTLCTFGILDFNGFSRSFERKSHFIYSNCSHQNLQSGGQMHTSNSQY